MEDGAMSPTYAADAADLVTGILRADAPCGTYHLSNSGACWWFDFAGEIARQCGIAPQLTGLDARDTDARVQRPLNSALSSEYLIGLGLRPRSWQDGVRRYLKATGRLDDR
jgi:dTDP-4-dehydrorhamnose reductase